MKDARGDWRSSVLGALYGLVECTSPKILISVARVVLVVRIKIQYDSLMHSCIVEHSLLARLKTWQMLHCIWLMPAYCIQSQNARITASSIQTLNSTLNKSALNYFAVTGEWQQFDWRMQIGIQSEPE